MGALTVKFAGALQLRVTEADPNKGLFPIVLPFMKFKTPGVGALKVQFVPKVPLNVKSTD